MVSINVTITPSLTELSARFGRVNARQMVQKNVERLAFLIERESKQVTPVRTGFLRANIIPIMGNLMATIGPLGVPYDIFVHEGTKFMRPRPFMVWGTKSAMEGFEEKFAGDVNATIKEIIE